MSFFLRFPLYVLQLAIGMLIPLLLLYLNPQKVWFLLGGMATTLIFIITDRARRSLMRYFDV